MFIYLFIRNFIRINLTVLLTVFYSSTISISSKCNSKLRKLKEDIYFRYTKKNIKLLRIVQKKLCYNTINTEFNGNNKTRIHKLMSLIFINNTNPNKKLDLTLF